MIFHKSDYSSIAKERLKVMMEADSLEYSARDIECLKNEISALISRHFNQPADLFEVKITLRQDKKRV